MASSSEQQAFPRLAPCPLRREFPAPYPPDDIVAEVLDPLIEPGSTTASRSLALAQEYALTDFRDKDDLVPIDGSPGGLKLVYGFVIDKGTLMDWAFKLRPSNIRLEEAKDNFEFADMLARLLENVERNLPNTLRHLIRGLPRFQSKYLSRLPPLVAEEGPQGGVFVVKHNFCHPARDVQVSQGTLDKLKKVLGVPNQEPAWYLVDISVA